MVPRALSTILLAITLGGPLGESKGGTPDVEGRIAGEYLVTLRAAADPAETLEAAFGDLGILSNQRVETAGSVYRIRVKVDPGPDKMRLRGEGHEGIERVQPNFRYSAPPSPRREQPLPAHP